MQDMCFCRVCRAFCSAGSIMTSCALALELFLHAYQCPNPIPRILLMGVWVLRHLGYVADLRPSDLGMAHQMLTFEPAASLELSDCPCFSSSLPPVSPPLSPFLCPVSHLIPLSHTHVPFLPSSANLKANFGQKGSVATSTTAYMLVYMRKSCVEDLVFELRDDMQPHHLKV